MKALAFGFGAALGIMFLALIGREAMAKEQAECLTRKLLRERRDRAWKAVRP